MKLAIVTTHPIQYNAPLFQLMAKEPGVDIRVFYTWSQSQGGAKYDHKFGRVIEWDIPLLEGYEHEFVENTASDPGSHHFRGIQNPGLIARIRQWNPDAILIFGWSFRSHLACLRYFNRKIPVIFRGDSNLLDEKPGYRKFIRRKLLSWVYSHVDFALYVGQANRAYFKAFGLRDEQLVFAPHAIDNDRFGREHDARKQEAMERRKALGIGESDVVVMFAGKLEDKKDPGFLLRLAKVLNHPGIRFLLVGNGHLESRLKEEAAGYPGIQFMDFQNQQTMPVMYRLADLFILHSVRNETWGLAVNEAMACGTPVIVSSKVGCAPDLVVQGQTGWIFEPGESAESDVAGILETLYRDRSLLSTTGRQALIKVQEYSFKAIAQSISGLLHKTDNKSRIAAV